VKEPEAGKHGGGSSEEAQLAALTEADKSAARSMGVSLKDYAATKARRTADGSMRFSPAE
jgi:phage I-like protein